LFKWPQSTLLHAENLTSYMVDTSPLFPQYLQPSLDIVKKKYRRHFGILIINQNLHYI